MGILNRIKRNVVGKALVQEDDGTLRWVPIKFVGANASGKQMAEYCDKNGFKVRTVIAEEEEDGPKAENKTPDSEEEKPEYKGEGEEEKKESSEESEDDSESKEDSPSEEEKKEARRLRAKYRTPDVVRSATRKRSVYEGDLVVGDVVEVVGGGIHDTQYGMPIDVDAGETGEVVRFSADGWPEVDFGLAQTIICAFDEIEKVASKNSLWNVAVTSTGGYAFQEAKQTSLQNPGKVYAAIVLTKETPIENGMSNDGVLVTIQGGIVDAAGIPEYQLSEMGSLWHEYDSVQAAKDRFGITAKRRKQATKWKVTQTNQGPIQFDFEDNAGRGLVVSIGMGGTNPRWKVVNRLDGYSTIAEGGAEHLPRDVMDAFYNGQSLNTFVKLLGDWEPPTQTILFRPEYPQISWGHSTPDERMAKKAAFTIQDVEATLDDPRHGGYGLYMANDLDKQYDRDVLMQAVANVASELGLTYEELFQWSNSRMARHAVDQFTWGGNFEAELRKDYLNRGIIDRLMKETTGGRRKASAVQKKSYLTDSKMPRDLWNVR